MIMLLTLTVLSARVGQGQRRKLWLVELPTEAVVLGQ